jgi:hypothetical protein
MNGWGVTNIFRIVNGGNRGITYGRLLFLPFRRSGSSRVAFVVSPQKPWMSVIQEGFPALILIARRGIHPFHSASTSSGWIGQATSNVGSVVSRVVTELAR